VCACVSLCVCVYVCVCQRERESVCVCSRVIGLLTIEVASEQRCPQVSAI